MSIGRTIGRIAVGAAGFGLGSIAGFPALGAAVGLGLGSMIFPPKQETKIRQVRSALGTSSVEGTPVSVIFGKVRVGGTLMWKGDLVYHEIVEQQSGGGKGGSSSTVVKDQWYTLSFAIAIGEGTMELIRIWEGKSEVSPSFTFYSGTSDQAADSFLTGKTGKAIAYRHTAYIVFQDYNIGASNNLPQLTFEVVSGQSKFDVRMEVVDSEGNTHIVIKTQYIAVSDLNNFITPAYSINKLLTNNRYGGGFTKTVDWLEANTDCIDRSYFINFALTERRDLSSIIEVIASHGWISTIFSGDRIKLILAKNTTPTKTIEIDDLLGKVSEQRIDVSESSKSERFNRLSIEFTDPAKDYSTRPVLVEDLADQVDRGIQKNTVSLLGFTNKEIVKDVGFKMLRNSLYGRRLINFSLGPQYLDLEVGDLVFLNATSVGLSQMRSRLLGMDETEEFNTIVSFREEPEFIYDPINYSVPVSSSEASVSATVGLSSAVGFSIEEMPKETHTISDKIEFAILYAKREGNSETIGFDIYSSTDDISFSLLRQSRVPLNFGILSTTLGKNDWLDNSSVEVDTSASADSSFATISRSKMMNGSNLSLIGEELVLNQTASLGTTNSYTLSNFVRNRFNTLARISPVGTSIMSLDNADKFTFLKNKIGSTYYFKAVPVNLFGAIADISNIDSINHTIQGWAYRPYFPGSIWLEENDINQRSKEKTNIKDVKIAWDIVDKETGFGRIGYGSSTFGLYSQDVDYIGNDVEIYINNTLKRTENVGTTQNYTYTEAFNISDNTTFDNDITFRVYTKSIYGRSKDYSEKIIQVI